MLECQVFQQIKRFYPQNTGRVSSEDLKKFQEFQLILLQPFSFLETPSDPSPLAHAIGSCSYLHRYRYQGVIRPDRYFFMLYG